MGELIIIEKWAENLEEVTVNRWLKQEGDRVEVGDSLCEIITDKATFEYEVERPGILHAIYAPAKSTVPVGYVIAFIGEQCEEPPEGIEDQNSAQLAEHRRLSELELDLEIDLLPQADAAEAGPSRIGATPAARRLAREHHLTIAEIAEALEIDGAVREEDVQSYLDMQGEQ